jgi:hypothetical protein
MNIFEFNEDSPVIVEEFMGSKIYYIDNFFKNPDNVVNFLDKNPGKLHHPNNIPPHFKDRNSTDFLDVRHHLVLNDVPKIYRYLSFLCGQKPRYNLKELRTNITKFLKNPFNDYKNNYWWPHVDYGYTALIYLNKNDMVNGTNLYKIEKRDEIEGVYEHTQPWRSKSCYSILKTIEPVYNRCVLFDGLKFIHGMNIENERYFDNEFRKNIVFFFKN